MGFDAAAIAWQRQFASCVLHKRELPHHFLENSSKASPHNSLSEQTFKNSLLLAPKPLVLRIEFASPLHAGAQALAQGVRSLTIWLKHYHQRSAPRKAQRPRCPAVVCR